MTPHTCSILFILKLRNKIHDAGVIFYQFNNGHQAQAADGAASFPGQADALNETCEHVTTYRALM